jgi:hypothetical protein
MPFNIFEYYEEYYLPGCDTLQSGRRIPTFFEEPADL